MATPNATSKGRNKPAPRLLIMTAALGVLGVILLARSLHHEPRPTLATGTLGTSSGTSSPTGPAGALTPPPEGGGSVGTPGTATTARETPTAAEISSALSGHPTSEPTSVPASKVPPAATDPSQPGVTPAKSGEAVEPLPRKQTPSEEVASALVTPDPALSSSFASKGTTSSTSGARTTVQSAVQQAAPTPFQSAIPMTAPAATPVAAPVVSAPVPLPVQPIQATPAPVTYAPARYVPPAPEVSTPMVTPVPVTAQPVVVLPAPRPQSTGSAVAVTVLTPAPSETAAATTGVKPAAPVTPTPESVTYLGSVQSEGGQTIALLTVGGRDETVAAGQIIPGTAVKVVTVTPTQLTLRDASGTRTVLLQEAE